MQDNPFDLSGADVSQGVKNLLFIAQAINELAKVMRTVFPQQGATASSASAGGATLPADPEGFITITLPSGATAMVPYYNP